MAQENVSPQAVELILADLTKGGLKQVINQDEVRLACKSALRGAGCFAPLDELVFQIVAKALELGSGYLSTGLGSRLSRWITTRPLLAPLLRRIADVCVKERDRNRLKDSLLKELRATPGPPLTLEDEKADLEIVQQFWSGRRFTQLDDALAEILATLQDDLRGRCDELSPRLGCPKAPRKGALL